MAVAVELHPAVVRFLACQPKRMLIGGEWVEAGSGKTFNAFNPATGQALAQVAEADRDDIDRAVRAARRAFEGAWAKVKPAARQLLPFRRVDRRGSRPSKARVLPAPAIGPVVRRTW